MIETGRAFQINPNQRNRMGEFGRPPAFVWRRFCVKPDLSPRPANFSGGDTDEAGRGTKRGSQYPDGAGRTADRKGRNSRKPVNANWHADRNTWSGIHIRCFEGNCCMQRRSEEQEAAHFHEKDQGFSHNGDSEPRVIRPDVAGGIFRAFVQQNGDRFAVGQPESPAPPILQGTWRYRR